MVLVSIEVGTAIGPGGGGSGCMYGTLDDGGDATDVRFGSSKRASDGPPVILYLFLNSK